MRQFLHILSFLMLLIFLTAEDCSNSNVEMSRQQLQNEMFQGIEDDFLMDKLSTETLSSFEKRAVQKLEDLDDYLNIYLNHELEEEFRILAKKMIYSSFSSEEYLNKFFKNLEFAEDKQNVLLFYPKIQNRIYIEFGSVKTSKRLQENSNQNYSGEVQFSHKMFEIIKSDTVLLNDTKGKIEIFADKYLKEFGSKKQEVWEIYFGEMK